MTTVSSPSLVLALLSTVSLLVTGSSTVDDRRSYGIKVDLPHTCNDAELLAAGDDDHGIVIQINSDGRKFINEYNHDADLPSAVAHIMEYRQRKLIYFTADAKLSYGSVMVVVAELRAASPELQILLATQQQTGSLHPGELPGHRPPPSDMVCVYPAGDDMAIQPVQPVQTHKP